MSEVRTVHQRIAEAAEIIAAETYTKSGTVNPGTRQAYNFIPIAQILETVRRAQAKAGVFVVFGAPEYDPTQRERRWEYETTNPQYGTKTTWYCANGHISATIYGADGDSIETVVPFEAKDNSDKLTNKILSNAMRSLYRTLYSIDEGSADPEAENVPNEVTVPKVDRRAAAEEDGFFSGKKPLVRLAKEVVETSRKSEAADALRSRYAETYGPIDEWSRETMEECLKEMRGVSQ